MAKKTTDETKDQANETKMGADETLAAANEALAAEHGIDLANLPPLPEAPEPFREPPPLPPQLESYIRQHDDTPRALATVRLEGGGPGDGTYLVDAPVPRSIGHRAERYVISRTEPGVTVYLWVNR